MARDPTYCEKQYIHNMQSGMNPTEAVTRFEACRRSQGEVPDKPMLGIDMAEMNQLMMDIGSVSFLLFGLLAAPKAMDALTNVAAGLYKQGLPGEFA